MRVNVTRSCPRTTIVYGFVNHQGFKQVKKAVVGVGWGGWRGGEFEGGMNTAYMHILFYATGC